MDKKTWYIVLGLLIIFIIVTALVAGYTMGAMVPNTGVMDVANVKVLANNYIFIAFVALFGGLVGGYCFTKATVPSKTFSPSSNTAPEGRKYCRHCGGENKSDASFCERCGKSLR